MTIPLDKLAHDTRRRIEEPADTELFSKLKSFIIARLIIGTTLLLGTAIPLEVSGIYSTSRFLFPLITGILIFTIIYSGLLNVLKNLKILAYIQLFGDIFIEMVVITATGGIESPFSILFVLTIIVSSYLLPRRGVFVTAFAISIVFGGLVLCQYKGWTSWWPIESPAILLPQPSFAIYIIFVNLAGFYIIAFLANSLSDRIRRMNILLTNKNVQYSYLWTLNRRIVNEIPTGLITASQEGHIISINPSAEKMLAYTPSDKGQSHLDQLFPGYLVQSILTIAKSDQSEKKEIHYQQEIDSETRWFHLEIILLTRKTQDPARLMIMINDVTDQKKLEEARRKADRWSTVAEVSAGMAHEIRNPLASISGSIEVLRDQLMLSDNESRLMNIIIKESDRLNRLISDFLDLSRPRPPEFSLINLHNLMNEMIVLIRSSNVLSTNIHFQLISQDENLVAEIDQNQFMQLAWNLAKNAIEAMPEGGTIMIQIERWDNFENEIPRSENKNYPCPPYAKLTFQDTGIGMDSEMLVRIFDPFTTFKKKGVGIGLAIVYRIIENHHGCIHVQSKPSEGAKFEIRVPLRQTR